MHLGLEFSGVNNEVPLISFERNHKVWYILLLLNFGFFVKFTFELKKKKM